MRVFESVDPHADGTITTEDLKAILKDLNPIVFGSGESVDRLLVRAGLARKTVIKFEDFVNWLDSKNGLAPAAPSGERDSKANELTSRPHDLFSDGPSTCASASQLRLVRRCSGGLASDANENPEAKKKDWSTKDVLKDGQHVFKPLQEHDDNGQAERRFYEQVQGFRLADFCPRFFGARRFEGLQYEYLEIEDITAKHVQPAVMDLKMGTKKFYAVAAQKNCGARYPPEKIRKQSEADLRRTSGSLGFLVSGLHVPPCAGVTELARDAVFGKAATDAEALGAVREFIERAALASGDNGVRILACAFAEQLRAILDWYETKHTHALYNSSLLFAYDLANPNVPGGARVCFVDFCHSWELEPEEVDVSGVDHGLKSLLALLEPLAS